MARAATVIDVRTMPDLARLAREVAEDGRPRVLRDADVDLAIISPALAKRRRGVSRGESDYDWPDEDVLERLYAEVAEEDRLLARAGVAAYSEALAQLEQDDEQGATSEAR